MTDVDDVVEADVPRFFAGVDRDLGDVAGGNGTGGDAEDAGNGSFQGLVGMINGEGDGADLEHGAECWGEVGNGG